MSPKGLSPKLIDKLRDTLLACGPFDSLPTLKAAFVDQRIRQWRDAIHFALTSQGLVDMLISTLYEKADAAGQNGLLLFLRVLHDRTEVNDGCKQRLAKLLYRLERELYKTRSSGDYEAIISSEDTAPAHTYSGIDGWLFDLGFVHGNPFAHVEADRERAFLPRFFVPVAGYDHIAGNDTVVVFAPRGSGKSALRVMLASDCAPQNARSSYLAVEFTDFDALAQKQKRGEPILIDEYVSRLLQAAARVLWETFTAPILQNSSDIDARERARSISPAGRTLLTRFVAMYYPELLYPAGLHQWFCRLDAGFALSLEGVAGAVTERCLRQRLAATALAAQPLALLLAEMSDLREMAKTPAGGPREEMKRFVDLLVTLRIEAVHFLIDRLDENDITANRPEAQADILEPLLANLPVLELPGTAFKFFLAQETHEALTGRGSFRLDRLRTQAPVKVRWDRAQLEALLNARVNVYSDGRYEEFVMLWAGQAPAGQIEQEMLDLALGSPRRLLTAGQLLFEVHFDDMMPGPPTLSSWEKSKMKLLQLAVALPQENGPIPDYAAQRLEDMQTHIARERYLLNRYEEQLTYADDPRQIGRIVAEINRQKRALAGYQQEARDLQAKLPAAASQGTGAAQQGLANIAAQLNALGQQLQGMEQRLASGQEAIRRDLAGQLAAILAHLDEAHRQTLQAVIAHLDANQVAQVELLLDAADKQEIARWEAQNLTLLTQQALVDLHRLRQGQPDAGQSQSLLAALEQGITWEQKLKLTIPIIPGLLEFESEANIDVMGVLNASWHRLLARLKRE